MAICPECEFDEIDNSELEEGDVLSCPECGKALTQSALGELEAADDDDLDDDEDEEDEEDEEEDVDETLLEDEEEVDEEDDE
jgi:hypothetical protein